MKKKILSLVLAMTLVIAYAVPVAAAESEPQVTEEAVAVEAAEPAPVADVVAPNAAELADKVSDDPAVQAAYEAYLEVIAAYNVHEPGPMKDALDKYEAITDEFTDAQSDEWTDLVYGELEDEDILYNLISANTVLYAIQMMEAFQANPGASTALDFVSAYEMCTSAEIAIELFDPNIEDAYKTAKSDYMASENVIKVYDAYSELVSALELAWYDEDFIRVCEEFEAVLDTLNELTEEEWADMADLMGEQYADDAFSKVLTDWVNANMVLQIGEPYDAFLANENADTAKAYIDAYDSVKNDTEFLTDEDKDVILAFFADGSYELAKGYLTGGSASDEPESDKSDKDTSPETGDDFNAAPYAALMVIAAAVAGLAVKRRRVQ